MKQLIQSFKTGETILEEVPTPSVGSGQVLIRTKVSLVSLGTEKMLVEFGKSNLISKARQQPDKVKMVLDKIKAEGLLPTIETVFNKLEQPIPLGYCNAGEVIEVGKGVTEFSIGDRVVSNGPHAEFVAVPKNLVAKIPENVSFEEASFTVVSSIGLQGIRLLEPTLGETIVVIGLGLIGLITAELLLANGCRVIGTDFDKRKLALAQEKGISTVDLSSGADPVAAVMEVTEGIGADGVIITASNKSNDIIHQSALMSRKRGKIVLVGVIGLDISRADFYEKELTFQVSCSYGPGRYDEDYEQKGQDYPLPFVRWTEKRNFETILQAISSKRLDVARLITERVKLEDYKTIYGDLGKQGSIASLLQYDASADPSQRSVSIVDKNTTTTNGRIAIIGAGNFTKMTMLPALKEAGAHLQYIVSKGGVSGSHLAKKYSIAKNSTDYHAAISDKEVDAVMITTRHNLHASMAKEALNANKHVFVEKPLALTIVEFEEVKAALQQSEASLMVGFNRRFSPHSQKIKELLAGSGAINLSATFNAGFIPKNVWVHDLEVGGGRIVGEACHFFDLMVYFTGSLIEQVCMSAMGKNPEENTDNASILVKFENGSQGVVNYFANGSKAYSKERVELYSRERTLIMDNFRSTQGYGFKGFGKLKTKLDKGHKNQFSQWNQAILAGGQPLIPFRELENVTLASFAAIRSLKEKKWVSVSEMTSKS